MKDMFALLKIVQHDMPRVMGYPWEGGCTKDQMPVWLEDALGRVIPLPFALCGTRDVWFHLNSSTSPKASNHPKLRISCSPNAITQPSSPYRSASIILRELWNRVG